jgi:signal transduction histidine kinase
MPESYDVLAFSDGRVMERYSQIQYVRGEANGRVWSYRDITERRQAAAERELLLESERAARSAAEHMSSMKDEFLATLSHELRTPLGAILGWAQILRRGAKSEQDLQRGLETIERNARAQAQLIDDLLDMSSINSGKLQLELQPLNPAAVIEAAIEAVRPLAASKGVDIDVLLEPLERPVPGDPGRLQQVVWNLLVNAIKFTARTGTVQVRLACVDGKAEISVTDNGVGIAPEFLGQMFDRFRQADGSKTRSFGGLGLGLSIVKSLTEMHGGMVRASSGGLGCGATFTVILPLLPCADGSATGRQSMHAFVPVDLAGIRVLVVDDEPDARAMLRRLLEDCEATVISAGSAAEALELLQRELPDVLVSDIGMPGVDGYELLKRVRLLEAEQGGRTPAIALTAFARPQDRTQALSAGYQAHVAKPVEQSELVATVAGVARRSR